MPLIDLKTDLKSLKYGQDKPGGGSSGQPFIVTDLDGSTSATVGPNNILRLVGLNRVPTIPNLSSQLNRSRIGQLTSQIIYDDTFIRGGILGSAQASLNDLFRIGAFLTTAPKGPLFIAKQVGLQLSNPKLETRKLPTGGGGGILGGLATFANAVSDKVAPGPTRIYNLGINTLAQVPVNAFGIHFNRHGLQPIQNENTKYINVVESNNEGGNNRLVGLTTKFKLGDKRSNLTSNTRLLNALSQAISALTRIPINIKPQDLVIDSYSGGPGSVYGIGRTTINRYSYTEDGYNIDRSFTQSKDYAGKSRSENRITLPNYAGALGVNNQFQPKEKAIGSYAGNLRGNTSFFNINAITAAQLTSTIGVDQNAVPLVGNSTTRTYQTIKDKIQTNISQSIPFVSGGYTLSNYTNTIKTVDAQVDRGATDFKYYGAGSLPAAFSGSKKTYDNTEVFSRNDSAIMSVVFRAVSPFEAPPGNTETWIFPAYMTGYKDDFTGTWNETNYIGRAESFFIYSKFKRNVSFNLKIPCFNKIQLFEKHRALGQLASVTAGAYNQTANGSLLGGVLLKINLGNYLVGEYAILNSVGYSIPDDASWDISDDALLSMYVDATFNLTIVHKNLPQYQRSGPNALKNGFYGYLPNPVNTFQQTQTGFITPQKVVDKFRKD